MEWFTELRHIQRGEGFGQDAFEVERPERQVRQTSIRSDARTAVAILSKESYIRVLRNFEAKQKQDISSFISKLTIFNKMPRKNVKSLIR